MANREYYNAGYLFDGDAYGYDKDCGRKWPNKKIDIITDPYFSEDESVDEDEIECEKYCLECAKRSEAVRDEKYDRQYLAKYIEENNLDMELEDFIKFLISLTNYFSKVVMSRDKMKFLPTKFGNRWKKKRGGHFRKIFI